MECYCDDGEQPTIYERSMVKRAKKAHDCYECHRQILPGESYERVRALYDGRWTVSPTCARCLDVREYVQAHAPCFCWMHGSVLEEARATVEQYGHESAGFYIGAMKRILRAERRAI